MWPEPGGRAVSIEALRDRAWQLGVETGYWDVSGQHHDASEATLRAIVDVLEADVARSSDGTLSEPVVVGRHAHVDVGGARGAVLTLRDSTAVAVDVIDGRAALPPDLPIGCHDLRVDLGTRHAVITIVVPPDVMPRSPHLAGAAALFAPAYALWDDNSPLPSFGQLASFAAAAHGLGIDVVTTLPLYAAFLDEPFDPSPYAPVSRLHWNEVYIDDASLPRAPLPDAAPLVDWRVLGDRRRRQLLAAAAELDPAVGAAMEAFAANRPDVSAYARFRAARPTSADSGAPAALVERSHLLAQYLANEQLASVQGNGRAVLGLDLPIGSHADGFETWAHPELFAPGMTVGAPPDDFFDGGQDWSFPPLLPSASRRDGHGLWRRLVARAGEHAGVLRIDHVMGAHRLWWVPEGMGATEGAYVRYPREELLAVIAAEAAVCGTTIVGENLGTVPDEVSEALARWDVVGMFEEQFNMYSPHWLPPVPARSMAGIRTHDMPAFAAAFHGDAAGGVEAYRRLLGDALGRPIGGSVGDVLDGALERLASSDAYLVVADLDDFIAETRPHNVPGMVLPGTWCRRLPRPQSVVLADPDVQRRATLLSTRVRSSGGTP